MAALLKSLESLFGGQAQAPKPVPAPADADFADYAGPGAPSAASMVSSAASTVSGAVASATSAVAGVTMDRSMTYTKWYRIWERTELKDFYSEMFILPFLIAILAVHFWGVRKNKRKAKSWIAAHAPVLQQEFAAVGFGRGGAHVDMRVLGDSTLTFPPDVLKERTGNEFITYATGRQNVAFVDIKLSLAKRFNPMGRLAEESLGFFFESMPAPKERMEATSYVFDGREADLVRSVAVSEKKEKFNSTYDGFIWAVVHKNSMQELRNGRYDLSLTTTKDHPKLPDWATVMSESAEITEALLTPELISAIHSAGESLDALIVSDQPIDKPVKLNEAVSKKRITLTLRLPSSTSPSAYTTTLPLFTQFLRLPDHLVSAGHFRPEVTRRIRATRDDEIRKIKKLDEGEKAEERRLKNEREKKKERDDRLKGLSAEEQKKFLEKERASEVRKGQKKRSMKG